MSGNPATISDVRVISIAHAIEQFFGTLRLAPRTQKAYRIGLRHFTDFVARVTEVEATALPVSVTLYDDQGRQREERRITLCGRCATSVRLDFTAPDGTLTDANGTIAVRADRPVVAAATQLAHGTRSRTALLDFMRHRGFASLGPADPDRVHADTGKFLCAFNFFHDFRDKRNVIRQFLDQR